MAEPELFVRDTDVHAGFYFVIARKYDGSSQELKEVYLYEKRDTDGHPEGDPVYRAEVRQMPSGVFVAGFRLVKVPTDGAEKEYFASVTYKAAGVTTKSKAVSVKLAGRTNLLATVLTYPNANSNISATAFTAYGTVDPGDTPLDFVSAQKTRLRCQSPVGDAPVSSSDVTGSDWWVLWEGLTVDKKYDLRIKHYGLSAIPAANLTAK